MSAHHSGRNDMCNPTSLQLVGLKHAILCGLFCLFLAIGFPFLFLGCNPDIDNMCLTWNIVHGTPYAYRLKEKVCKDCRGCDEHGCDYCSPEYVCYQGYIDLQYGDPGDDCEYEYVGKFGTEQGAYDSMRKNFPPNSTHNFILRNYKDDSENICLDLKHGKGLWTGGVVLLCLAGVVLLVWIVYACFSYKDLADLILSTPSYVPVDYHTAPSNTATNNNDSTGNSALSPYTPVNASMEMVRAPPTPLANPYPATVANTYSYKSSPSPASVTPFPSVTAYPAQTSPINVNTSTGNFNTNTTTTYVANNNANRSYNNSAYANVVATPAVPSSTLPTATPAATTAPMMHTSVNMNTNMNVRNPPIHPTYTAVSAYPTAAPYSPPVSATYSASVAQATSNVRAPSAHEEYDMY